MPTVSSVSRIERTPLLTECMPIFLAEEVQKRLPNLWGGPIIFLLTVVQGHIVGVECSFVAGVEISDKEFPGYGVLEFPWIVRPTAVVKVIVSRWRRKFQQISLCRVSHNGTGEVAHHTLVSGTLVS